jgi:hypothetical protein
MLLELIMDTRTLLLTFMTLIVVGIVVLVVYGLLNSYGVAYTNPISPQKDSVELIGPLHSGMDSTVLTANLPRSMNENDGLEFSYTAWILVDDFSYGTSKEPVIFMRGTGSPVVKLIADTNSIVVSQKLYNGKQDIQIRNVPAEKLIHLAVTVSQTALDVYVNGLLHTHKSLDSLPLIEEAPVQVGPSGGWKGKIGSFVYYNYALSSGEVRSIASKRAKRNPNDEPPNPPYFDTTWWVGRNDN